MQSLPGVGVSDDDAVGRGDVVRPRAGEGPHEENGIHGRDTGDAGVPVPTAELFRRWWAVTKPLWDAEDKARRLKLWGEGLETAMTMGEGPRGSGEDDCGPGTGRLAGLAAEHARTTVDGTSPQVGHQAHPAVPSPVMVGKPVRERRSGRDVDRT